MPGHTLLLNALTKVTDVVTVHGPCVVWDYGSDTRASSSTATVRGCRGADDPGNLWFDLLQHRPERPAMDDLWAGFHSLSEATRKG